MIFNMLKCCFLEQKSFELAHNIFGSNIVAISSSISHAFANLLQHDLKALDNHLQAFSHVFVAFSQLQQPSILN